jgi:hypothetical protein
MKQKIIIGVSVLFFLVTVYLIVSDLFQDEATSESASCCGDDIANLKKIDTSLVGYTKVKVINPGIKGLSGIYVGTNKLFISGNRQMVILDSAQAKPIVVTVDSAINCITSDGKNLYLGIGSQIAQYDMEGNLSAYWKPYSSKGFITSLAVNGNYVYAADAINKIVLKYSTDGQFIKVIGKKDSITGAPGFSIPSPYFDIAFDGFDDLWVVNPGKLELESFNKEGFLRSSWGNASSGNSGFIGCCNPAHMAVLPNGFVTYEKGTDKIKAFDPAGRFLCFVAGAGSFRNNTDFQIGNLNLVKDLAVNEEGDVYVLDVYNQVNIFRKKGI